MWPRFAVLIYVCRFFLDDTRPEKASQKRSTNKENETHRSERRYIEANKMRTQEDKSKRTDQRGIEGL
jgi:hypothetical protein